MLDPRLSLELVALLRKYGLRFRIPMGLRDLCLNHELLVTDNEGLEYITKSKVSTELCVEVLNINNVEEIYSVLLPRILDTSSPISVGIDLGRRIAYAVLAGRRLLTCDYVDRVEEIKNIIERLSSLKPRIILLGIGAEYLKELPAEISSIIESEKVAAAYIIEEEKTNRSIIPRLAGVEVDKLPEDLKAAIAIAVRVYEKYMLTQSLR
ncbi:MAG: hypothetical protein QXF63_04695 [Sulfolobales archaeon]